MYRIKKECMLLVFCMKKNWEARGDQIGHPALFG